MILVKYTMRLQTRICDEKGYFPFLTFMGTCIVIYFYSKTNQMHNSFKFIEYYSTCFRSLSVHHQESKTANKQSTNLYDIYLKLYVPSWTPDDGRRDRPKHVE